MGRWWIDEPWRLVQTNLREIDADLDAKELIHDVIAMGGNTLLFNVGGIQANYPTALEYHFQNPFLQGDLVRSVLEECKARDVRLIGRFDFSKANEIFFAEHPEWFYRSLAGDTVNYNGQVHTCVNGYYQREYSLEILREALTRYDLDGVFFNMFGYQTHDYSGNYHGICQCNNCRRAFKEFSGMDLPREEDESQLVFRKYRAFQRNTVMQMLDRIADLVKSFSEDIAVFTYDTYRVDIVRLESNSAVDRPLPHFLYSGSDNVRSVTSSWSDKIPSNCAVHFVDIPYRHVGVSEHLTELRLAQNIANGGGPDYYVIGTLDRQNDRTAESAVGRMFDFYAKNEGLYSGAKPAARVALMAHNRWSSEYQGIFRILSEEHILFHVLDPEAVRLKPNMLTQYQAIILPGDVYIDSHLAKVYDEYVELGGRLLATQRPLLDTLDRTEAPIALKSLGVEEIVFARENMRSAYFEITPKDVFTDFDDLDLCFLDGVYYYTTIAPSATRLMRLIPPCMYGPPEKCYYEVTVDAPGAISNAYGKGLTSYLPWELGRLYNRHSWPGHRRIFVAVLENVLGLEREILTDAPDVVEIVLLTQAGKWMEPEKHWLLQLVNGSGHSGTAYHKPITMHNIRITLPVPRHPASVRSMTSGQEINYSVGGGRLEVEVPRLDLLESVLIEW